MKRLLIIFLLFISQELSAQNYQPYFSAVVVNNIDSSISWYKKVLGLELKNRTDLPERGVIQANLFSKKILIELIQVTHSFSEDSLLKNQPAQSRIRGFAKIGFIVKNIEQVFQQMKQLNIKFTGRLVTDPVSRKKTFLVNDPDNNLVQIFEQ